MLKIDCPWCGARAQTEFTYVGDATKRRPDPGTATEEEFYAYVYLRDNPRGPHQELWHHTAGCRRHVRVLRDVVTHEIMATGTPDEDLAMPGSGEGGSGA